MGGEESLVIFGSESSLVMRDLSRTRSWMARSRGAGVVFLIFPFDGMDYDSSDKVVLVGHHFGDLPGRPLDTWETFLLDDYTDLGIGLWLDPFRAICA